MSKQLDNLIAKLNDQVYFTSCPVDFAGHEDYKYFLCFTITKKIVAEWKTQAEAIEDLKEIIKEGVIRDSTADGTVEIVVVDETPIRSARRQAGLTQQQACDLCHGVPKRSWEDWEGGRRKPTDYLEKFILEKLEKYINESRNA